MNQSDSGTVSVGIYIFPDVEVLDFAGPYEVFTTASRVFKRANLSLPEPFTVFTIAPQPSTIRARAGLVVQPDYTFANHPPIDLLLIPGGVVTKELETPDVVEWITQRSAIATLTASVCTGSFLLAKAGLLNNQMATTHWEDIPDMRAMFPNVQTVEQQRWVDAGDVVTSAGISAGIDMSLHLVERLAGRELALQTARQMDFDWHENT
ncbi:DJ-1/PfpI family protein [Leptolyngbya sp. FACHB-8]|uniref:DJ-1/PfpI family protein n=1 Tax=unclassified Leptolyngbya TaxID=2650499 RepID=UPI00168A2627|nr:DJ-1/PfpI family protein [Leptolyngbya sp. FACHB-8]MBD1912940.1 DJ-1/PfpI family protein [Leptolyngbya sp. FACHB-8]